MGILLDLRDRRIEIEIISIVAAVADMSWQLAFKRQKTDIAETQIM